jgi:nucleolar protein TMA23
MDAHAHLLSLGWAGPGHSLDSRPHKGRRGLAYDPKQVHNTGNGLIKPLLISQKKNTFGIGKKAHEPAAGNEWWLKGFETALSNVGKSESERTSGTATPELGRPANGYAGKHIGLYGFFVKGGEMEGTIGLDTPKEFTLARRKKRKSDGLDSKEGSPNSSDGEKESTETRKRRKPKEGTEGFEQVSAFLQARDKDEKRRRRKQKADALEEFQQVGEFFEARSSRRKASTSVNPHTDTSKSAEDVTAKVSDDGCEERRRQRKERKAAKMAKALEAQATLDAEIAPTPTTTNTKGDQPKEESADDAPIEKAARKAEKRRKKLERK